MRILIRRRRARGSVAIQTARGGFAGSPKHRLGSLRMMNSPPCATGSDFGLLWSISAFLLACIVEIDGNRRRPTNLGREEETKRAQPDGEGKSKQNDQNKNTFAPRHPAPFYRPVYVEYLEDQVGQRPVQIIKEKNKRREKINRTSRSVHACPHCRLRRGCRSGPEQPRSLFHE